MKSFFFSMADEDKKTRQSARYHGVLRSQHDTYLICLDLDASFSTIATPIASQSTRIMPMEKRFNLDKMDHGFMGFESGENKRKALQQKLQQEAEEKQRLER